MEAAGAFLSMTPNQPRIDILSSYPNEANQSKHYFFKQTNQSQRGQGAPESATPPQTHPQQVVAAQARASPAWFLNPDKPRLVGRTLTQWSPGCLQTTQDSGAL
jgi:hypothetical protein